MTRPRLVCLAAGWCICFFGSVGAAAGLELHLPLARTACQDNELISVSVVRSSPDPLHAGELQCRLTGSDGSALEFVFQVPTVAAANGPARAVEHLHLNGWLLRPGAYTVTVAADGATARTNLEVFSHVRRSSFQLVNWGRAQGREQLAEGEDNLGYNLFYGEANADTTANFIRAGVDFMACCVMSGGHQMDLRTQCDWSDPFVIRGGTRRVVERSFRDRTRPNVWGVHFYDEPGLTWAKDVATGQATPHAVPWQWRQYEAAVGEPRLDWKSLDPADPGQTRQWARWARWKLGFLDAAWQDAAFGVARVRPDYVSLTQSQYAYGAFTDGYYFPVVRSLPITSGHGGYHDFGPGYFNPVMFLEFARARNLAKPNWYLPTWYGSTTADEFRLEHYLAFQCGLQGLISPPELDPAHPAGGKAAPAIVEVNRLGARLGTIFTTMPATRPPVALLFSLSQLIHAQTQDREVNYAHETPHGRNMAFSYLAGKLLQHQFQPLLDEEVRDGTLAAHYRAIILTSINHLDPLVIGGLEAFARQGGLVLLTADCTVKVAGGVKLPVTPAWPEADRIAELQNAGKPSEAGKLMQMRQELEAAARLAAAIRPHLEHAGIRPPLGSTEPGIVVTRHAAGDVEYVFAVNASHDLQGDPMLGMKRVATTLTLPDDGRPVYDAVQSQRVTTFQPKNGELRGPFRFGAGQMRVFARTSRPIGGVSVATPVVRRELERLEAPLCLELTAVVLDRQGGVLSGSIPLRIEVTDALGATRYDLYRATTQGILALSLPLALNDPPGAWKITATELLGGTRGTNSFQLRSLSTCSAAAGLTWRAVHWPQDRTNIFRFFRQTPGVTIVTGSSAFNRSAAERLTRILEPWNVHCTTLTAAEANRPRVLSRTEAETWVGLDFASQGQLQPGTSNPIPQVGVAVQGPLILLGNPDDNPLIKLLANRQFLPYQPDPNRLPGPGRGYVAWQREALGVGQESVTLLAYDAPGLAEAVGTMYEFLAGLEPLTPLAQPARSHIEPARTTHLLRTPTTEWTSLFPSGVDSLTLKAGMIEVVTHDGTVGELTLRGASLNQRARESAHLPPKLPAAPSAPTPVNLAEMQQRLAPARLAKLSAVHDNLTAVACWGGTLDILDREQLVAEFHALQDITALVWAGDRLIFGDADGRVVALHP